MKDRQLYINIIVIAVKYSVEKDEERKIMRKIMIGGSLN